MRQERFELPTFGSVDRRSIQLSYWRRALKSSGRGVDERDGACPAVSDGTSLSVRRGGRVQACLWQRAADATIG
jgi:hypothetical protein